jgi:hypothetical protein
MTASVVTGIPGVHMHLGDHICAFYRGREERDEVLVPYLRSGLEHGDPCVCVLDGTDSPEVPGVAEAGRGQLTLYRSQDTYLRDGQLVPERMLDFWDASAKGLLSEAGAGVIRAAGEMTWALRDLPGVDLLVTYEAELNRFLPKYPQIILCLYDLERFTDGEALLDILRTHPKVLMSGQVVDNPWYVEPDAFLARDA